MPRNDISDDQVAYVATIYVDEDGMLNVIGEGDFDDWDESDSVREATVKALRMLADTLEQYGSSANLPRH